jgi:hypothetical protein
MGGGLSRAHFLKALMPCLPIPQVQDDKGLCHWGFS